MIWICNTGGIWLYACKTHVAEYHRVVWHVNAFGKPPWIFEKQCFGSVFQKCGFGCLLSKKCVPGPTLKKIGSGSDSKILIWTFVKCESDPTTKKYGSGSIPVGSGSNLWGKFRSGSYPWSKMRIRLDPDPTHYLELSRTRRKLNHTGTWSQNCGIVNCNQMY